MSQNIKKNNTLYFCMFLIAYFMIWGLLPLFCFHSLIPATPQNLAWGHVLSWGYDQHPPLGAWVITLFSVILQNNEWAGFFAGASCLVFSCWCIYKIGSLYLKPENAAAAAVISTLIKSFLGKGALEYSQNTIMLPFWLLSVYLLIKITQENKRTQWVLLAMIAALSMLAKYESAIILFLEAAYLLAHFHKKYLMNLCIASSLFIALLLPHILWLIHTDFLPFRWALFRGYQYTGQYPLLMKHVWYPISCFINQPTSLIWPAAVLLLSFQQKWAYRGSSTQRNRIKHILIYFGTAPLLLTCLISLIFGMNIQTEWGYPFFSLTFLSIFYYFNIQVRTLKMIVITTLIALMLVGWCGKVWVYGLMSKLTSMSFPTYTLSKSIESYWAESGLTSASLYFVSGDYPLAYYPAAYLPSKPLLLGSSLWDSPWINKREFLKSTGLLIVHGCDQTIRNHFKRQFNIISYRCITVPATNKLKTINLNYTLYIAKPLKDAF